MLWPETHAGLQGFAAQFAAYGTRNEPVARSLYVNARVANCPHDIVAVWESGLLVSLEHGWLGCSPDFVFAERKVLTKPQPDSYVIINEDIPDPDPDADDTENVPSSIPDDVKMDDVVIACGEIKCPATGKLYCEDPKHAATGGFPHYYYDQIQGIMALNNWPFCDVVVYTPTVTTVQRFPADLAYWAELLDTLRMFYFDMFVPRLNARLAGRIKPGDIDEIMSIPRVLDFDDDDEEDDDHDESILYTYRDHLCRIQDLLGQESVSLVI